MAPFNPNDLIHTTKLVETIEKMELCNKSKEALKEALIRVKDQREEAFLLLNAIPEIYLPDIS